MARSLKDILRKLADEIETDEKGEAEEAQRAKLEALEQRALSEDDRAVLTRVRALITEMDEEDAKEAREKEAEKARRQAEREAKAKEEKPKPGEEEKPKGKTRPGRKSGNAYDWWVDEQGQVVKLDVARIYDGTDEPEEVELPEPKPDEEEEAA